MLKRAICLVLCISVLSLTSGCATYKFGRLPSPYVIDQPSSVTQKNVAVAVKFMDSAEALAVFDCEMDKHKISPVFIIIENKSSETYGFRKADIDSSYLSGEEVAKKCARSTMTRVLTYGALGLVVIAWIVFIPMMIGEMINCPKINAQMRSDYCGNEIADATIGPGHSLSGVMFVAPFKSGEQFTIPLVNKETGERVIFRFAHSQLGSVGIAAPTEKKDDQEAEAITSKPVQNFGPRVPEEKTDVEETTTTTESGQNFGDKE